MFIDMKTFEFKKKQNKIVLTCTFMARKLVELLVRGWSVSEAGARLPEQLYSRPRKRNLSTTGM